MGNMQLGSPPLDTGGRLTPAIEILPPDVTFKPQRLTSRFPWLPRGHKSRYRPVGSAKGRRDEICPCDEDAPIPALHLMPEWRWSGG